MDVISRLSIPITGEWFTPGQSNLFVRAALGRPATCVLSCWTFTRGTVGSGIRPRRQSQLHGGWIYESVRLLVEAYHTLSSPPLSLLWGVVRLGWLGDWANIESSHGFRYSVQSPLQEKESVVTNA